MLHALIEVAATGRRSVQRLARAMGLVAGWGFIGVAGLITFDVLSRRFLGISTQATTELSGYVLAFGIAWGWRIRCPRARTCASMSSSTCSPRACARGCT